MTLPLAGGLLVALAGLPALAFLALAVLVIPAALMLRLREPRPGTYSHG